MDIHLLIISILTVRTKLLSEFQCHFKVFNINVGEWDGWITNDVIKLKHLRDKTKLTIHDYCSFFRQVFRKVWNGGFVQWFSLVRIHRQFEWKLTGNDIPI